jgi:hypothetical protein
MARIQTYIVDTVLSDSDLILGSNADDSLDTVNFKLSDVKAYVLGGGGSGVVTSVSGTGTVSGLTLTGTVTSSGNLTLGGTLALTSSDITSGLGFTPYDAANPDGFTSNPSYDYGAVGAAGNINMALSGSDGSNDVVTIQAGSNITLTDNGSNTFTIASSGGGGGGGVTSFTNVNGQFVSAAISNSGATGAVTTGVIDLSATGTPSSTTFLRGDNTWATPTGGGSVTEVFAEVLPTTNALDVTVATSTSTPNISIEWQGPDNTRLVAGNGTLVLPVITAITTNNSSGVATLTNNVLNIPDYSGSSITLTTTGTTGPATLAGGVLNVPNYSSNPGSGTVTRVGALNGTFISSSSADITSVGDLTYDLSATGTPSATSFLRGDNTWATPAGSGTVTEVTGDQSTFIRVTTTNATTTPVVTALLTATGQTPDVGNFLRGDNTWADAIILTTNGTTGAAQFNSATGTLNIPQYLSSAVQSVGVSMPSAFTVSNSPVTSNGTIAVTGAGTGAQYVNGLGALAAISTIPANINLTTTGTSGAATFSNNNLNIPQYVTPAAGSNGDVQFNSNGAFAAEGEFNYATSTNTLTITGVVNQPSLKLASAQQTTPFSGALLSEIESYYSSTEVGKIKFVADGSFNPSSSPSRLEIQTTSVSSTVTDTKLEIGSSGQLRLNKYGSSAPFSGAPVSSLAVDANGYVIENAFSRPASATNISYNTNLTTAANQYSVESVNSGSIGAPSGNGKVRVRYAGSAQAQNVQEITVANNQLNGTNNALALQNMAVGGTITLNQVGGGASGILTYTIRSRTNETGYVRFELVFVSGNATYVILTTTTDAFSFTADYEHVLSGGYNRLSVTNASGSTANKFRIAPPAVATPGQEIIVELNRSNTAGADMVPSYVVRDGNSTFLKTRDVTEIQGTTINLVNLDTNDTAIIKFQVNVIGGVKGLTVLGSNQMIYA